jgi:hypothetical protein
MTTKELDFTKGQRRAACTNPRIEKQVLAYIVDRLKDSKAEEVEDHLLECLPCREFFLIMLNVRREAQQAGNLQGGEDWLASNETRVPRLADTREKLS